MSKLIPLRGKYGVDKFAIVDDDMFDEISQYKWHCIRAGYAFRSVYVGYRKPPQHIAMHDMIVGKSIDLTQGYAPF